MADKGGIQLLPETRKRIDVSMPGENRLLHIGYGVIVAVALLFGAAKGMTHSLRGQVETQNASLAKLNQERDKVAEEQLISLGKQSVLINSFLSGHIFWSIALTKIEKALQQQVQFSTLNASLDKHEITFTAQAPSYTIIARQIASLVADDGIKDVQISNAKAVNNGRYEFVVKLIIDDAKYLKP